MSKKKKSSGAGKGDRNRVSDKKKYDDNKENLLVELMEKTKQQIIYISHGSL